MSYVVWLAALTTLAMAIVALALELASSRRRTTELQGRLSLLEKTLNRTQRARKANTRSLLQSSDSWNCPPARSLQRTLLERHAAR